MADALQGPTSGQEEECIQESRILPQSTASLEAESMRIRIDQFNELHLIGALQWMIHDFIDQSYLTCERLGL